MLLPHMSKNVKRFSANIKILVGHSHWPLNKHSLSLATILTKNPDILFSHHFPSSKKITEIICRSMGPQNIMTSIYNQLSFTNLVFFLLFIFLLWFSFVFYFESKYFHLILKLCSFHLTTNKERRKKLYKGKSSVFCMYNNQ